MRHRRRGRILGRSPSHRRAMLKNLASSLLLTERDAEFDDNPPEVKGRVVTTIAKAKEVRPIIERCITIARKTLEDQRKADSLDSTAERNSEEWRQWRSSSQWNEWNQAIAPVLTARRRAIQILGDKEAVSILFDTVAPRFEDRPGGYTRIMRLAQPRLGDGGTQVILEFVGVRDRIKEAAPEPIQVESDSTESSESAGDVSAETETPENETDDSNAAEGTDAESDTSGEVDSGTEEGSE
ncbi:MAG: L17 family ribosomal protein [Planctomycetota bacterium]|nr:L17 family ribosomal protein [Planctomycetota bacterium]MEC8337185.1 L17 family ribosomal protein [Planctomycetota bacterium]